MKCSMILVLLMFFSAVGAVWAREGEIPTSCVQLKPGSYNVDCARAFVLHAIRNTALGKGVWWRATGLLGSALIPQKPNEAIEMAFGYTSIFESAVGPSNTKITNEVAGFYSGLFARRTSITTEAIIAKREYYISLIGHSVADRFIYNEKGNYGVKLSPDAQYANVTKIGDYLDKAYTLYTEIQKRGLNDTTLGDAIGIAGALQNYDGIKTDTLYSLPFAQQIY